MSSQKNDWALRSIIIIKLLEALSLFIFGLVLHHVLNGPEKETVHGLIDPIQPDIHNHLIHWLLEKILAVPRDSLRFWSVGTFIYAALFAIEGIGLIYRKTWAEWMVVITTGGFIPFELYEIFDPSGNAKLWLLLIKIVVFFINVSIVIYLIKRLKREALERHQHKNELDRTSAS